MKEVWKNVVGFEGFYIVSNLGNVKSVDRLVNAKNGSKRLEEGKEMTKMVEPSGYLWVSLRKNGKRYTKLVHRLVAEAFLPNPNNLPIVNHKDENKANPIVDNLEWCTQQYNTVYNNVQDRKRKINITCPVIQYDIHLNELRRWNSITEAAKYLGTSGVNISYCCKGKRN